MRCQACREALRALVQDSKGLDDRRDLALHLVECNECASFLDSQSLWDQAVVDLLRREAPRELRESILAAAGPQGAASGESSHVKPLGSLRGSDRLRFFWWAGTRGMSWRTWVEAIAWAALVLFAIYALRWWRG